MTRRVAEYHGLAIKSQEANGVMEQAQYESSDDSSSLDTTVNYLVCTLHCLLHGHLPSPSPTSVQTMRGFRVTPRLLFAPLSPRSVVAAVVAAAVDAAGVPGDAVIAVALCRVTTAALARSSAGVAAPPEESGGAGAEGVAGEAAGVGVDKRPSCAARMSCVPQEKTISLELGSHTLMHERSTRHMVCFSRCRVSTRVCCGPCNQNSHPRRASWGD